MNPLHHGPTMVRQLVSKVQRVDLISSLRTRLEKAGEWHFPSLERPNLYTQSEIVSEIYTSSTAKWKFHIIFTLKWHPSG